MIVLNRTREIETLREQHGVELNDTQVEIPHQMEDEGATWSRKMAVLELLGFDAYALKWLKPPSNDVS